jgi:hypothetical protein
MHALAEASRYQVTFVSAGSISGQPSIEGLVTVTYLYQVWLIVHETWSHSRFH